MAIIMDFLKNYNETLINGFNGSKIIELLGWVPFKHAAAATFGCFQRTFMPLSLDAVASYSYIL